MESNITPDTQDTQYKQVTVDVPEDRVAEFHAFFGRFLAASGRRRRGRRGRHPGRGHHGRGCAHRREAIERRESAERYEGDEREGAEPGQPAVETTEL
jgi:hypothetical protein